MYRPPGVVDREFGLYFEGFWAAGPVQEARKWPEEARGPILRTWRPFWTHFGQFSPIRARPPICDLHIVTLPQMRLLRLEHCVDTAQMSVLAIEGICLVSTADICLVSAADICPVSTADICPVSTEDIYPVSTKDATAAGLRPAAVMSSVETG